MSLLPFGQPVQITHPYLQYQTGWITNVAPSYYVGHDWQYQIRTDGPLIFSIDDPIERWLLGGDWFDEKDIRIINGDKMPMMFEYLRSKFWPPKANIGCRPGIWGINGAGVNQELINKMYSWNPGAITCFYDYIQANGVYQYKDKYPNVPVILRFQHDENWHQNPTENVRNKSAEIISKWSTIKDLNPYVYFCNEMNLHYENGDDNPANQHLYETPEFYEKYAGWVWDLADRIKQQIPDMRLVCPPFAYGHHEDGAPDDDGNITESFAGYEYLLDVIETHFDSTICGHYYWGNAGGSNHDWLYGDESKWHAFRWKKVLSLFENYFDLPVKMIIDECGNFAPDDSDFTDQLIYYAENTLNDSRIIAMTYFLFADPTHANDVNNWQLANDLDNHLQRLKNMPDVYVMKPDDDEPPQPPPPIPPPPQPVQNVTMTIERGAGLHLIVGNWFEPNIELSFYSPFGNSYFIRSGTKPEFGKGGFEIYAPEIGDYTLYVDNNKFTIPMNGEYTKLHFERTDEPLPAQFRIVSNLLDDDEAEEIWNQLEQLYPGLFSIE